MFTLHRSILIALAVVCVAGCASSGKSQGEKVAAGFNQTKVDLVNAQATVDKTLAAMDQFQYTANLSTLFDNYKKAVDELEQAGVDAKRRAQAMRESSEMYVNKWEKEMEGMNDPEIKASMQSRKEAVRSNFEHVRTAAAEARRAYEPFLKDNQNIRKALSVDLSPAAVRTLAPAMEKARADGKILKERLSALQQQLQNIERGMAPNAGAATAG